MARNFPGSDDYWERSSIPVSGFPFTLYGYGRKTTTGTDGSLFSISDFSAAGEYVTIGINASNFLSLATGSAGDSGSLQATTTFTVDEWFSFVAVLASATSRNVYFQGGNNPSPETNNVGFPTGTDVITIGALGNSSSHINDWVGDAAECGISGRAWDAADALAHFNRLVRWRLGDSVFHCPLMGNDSPELDIMGGATMTLTGTSAKAGHPRSVYPFGDGLGSPSVGPAGIQAFRRRIEALSA